MHSRLLGTTGIHISAISFGAGPVPALLTKAGALERQRATLRRALEAGINWFDTAATYGEGQSERSLGESLGDALEGDLVERVHIATKVRIPAEFPADLRGYIRESVRGSLERLRRPRVTLLQLHNSITAARGAQPTSLAPEDVLGTGGVLEAFQELRQEGYASHLGLTGLGEPPALLEVLRTRGFEVMQIPFHVCNPSAGTTLVPAGVEANYGNLIGECERLGIGVLAIRVLAGGALAGQPPSDHTRSTKFFPMPVFERDRRVAEALARELPVEMPLKELAIRYVLGQPGVSSALIGFSSPEQIDEALEYAARGPLDPELSVWVNRWLQQHG
ncbi:MAG: aldo/keto reductase [Planctomycetales bacterium]